MGIFAGDKSDSPKPQRKDYERHKERAAALQRKKSQDGRDIGELPAVKDPKRRKAAEASLKKFCESYGKTKFPLKWSPDHLRVIDILQSLVLGVDRYALAMPRGSGKTTLCTWAALWALCCGYHSFIVLIAANAKLAKSLIKKIRWELERNDKLAEDFPEICYVLRQVNFTYQARPLYKGKIVRMKFLAEQIVLPDIPGAASAGATVNAVGLTGSLRGMQENNPDGSIVRPTLILIDDPQTKQSAASREQCNTREGLINEDILGMVGPDDSLSLIMTCTVMRDDDVAARFLDPEKHHSWSKTRVKLLLSFPKNMDLWRDYWAVRTDGLKLKKDKGKAGNAFYRKHRRELDEGCEVYWHERIEKGDLSAIQSAMNMYFDRPSAFWAEGQQDPAGGADLAARLSISQVIEKALPGIKRQQLPVGYTTGVAGIDVGGELLHWVMPGWKQGFSGHVSDYNTWPRQTANYYTTKTARYTLSSVYKSSDEASRIYQGLNDLIEYLLSIKMETVDGVAVPIRRILIDARYRTETIRQFCERSKYRALIFPTFGEGRRPVQRTEKPGYESADGWQIAPPAPGKPYREFIQDSNYWIGFTQDRFRESIGSDAKQSSLITLPGLEHGETHDMFAEHITSEVPGDIKQISGMRYQTYAPLIGRENHFLDALKMCAAAAASLGIQLSHGVTATPKKKTVKREPRFATFSE